MTVLQALTKRGVRPSVYQDRLELGVSAIEKLLSRMRLVKPSGCWEWTGARVAGYGVVHIRKIRLGIIPVHRLLFECANGPVAEGYHVHHKTEGGCIGKACGNPDHLSGVTVPEHRRIHADQREFCKYGHPYTEENTFVTPEGWRRCRECDLLRARLIREDERKAEPVWRMKYKWHQDKLKTHCLRGHPLSGENAYWAKTKWGVYPSCKACRDRANKACMARKKAAKQV